RPRTERPGERAGEASSDRERGRLMSAATWSGEVHPFADLFPMLPDDELHLLAEDIRTNGLQQPLVIDSRGRLVAGRNRLRACEIADVEPAFDTLDTTDDGTI